MQRNRGAKMELLSRLNKYRTGFSNRIAFINGYTNEAITYSELLEKAEKLACFIARKYDDNLPIIVYGHKSPLMLVSFLGCAMSGHPYCPVDISVPKERIKDIVEESNAKLIIKIEPLDVSCSDYLSFDDVVTITENSMQDSLKLKYTSDDEVFYIIFTSGSTGKPKGVQITANCLDNYLRWMESILKDDYINHKLCFLNQAPFSFDLSVMDTFSSLFLGGTIWSLDKRLQKDYNSMVERINNSNINIWVSTPSFANMMLMNPDFNGSTCLSLKTFLFCGEVLTNKTAKELIKRFPSSKVINTYGPTESTVAVTDVLITNDMANSKEALPVGRVKPGSYIFIMDTSYSYPEIEEGKKGEIVIAGDTVAKGYLNRPELTNEKFFYINTGSSVLFAYKTGDEGWKKEGLVYYAGRKDFQLKINGYRIELGDIENNLLKINNIKSCVVLPIERNGEFKGLAAFLCLDIKPTMNEFDYSQQIRNELLKLVPHYMVPKKYIYIDQMPQTNNGKIDRSYLKKILQDKGV